MTRKETERRRRLFLVASQLARITDKSLSDNGQDLGRWANQIFSKYPKWSIQSILEVLDRCPIGYKRGQVMGALKKEFLKTSDFSTMQEVYPPEIMKVLNIK